MRILGIDPGYERLGWGVLDKQIGRYELIDCGVIKTPKSLPHPTRLGKLFEELTSVITKYSPEGAVIEKLFFATNAKTAINVAEARGVILLACERGKLNITELTPLQIKSAVTGNGQADKKAVEKMVRLQVKNIPDKLVDDTLDALAAALSI